MFTILSKMLTLLTFNFPVLGIILLLLTMESGELFFIHTHSRQHHTHILTLSIPHYQQHSYILILHGFCMD